MQITQNLTFYHRQELILPFLQDVAHFLQTHLPSPGTQLNFQAKVIVTELLTNSIKHSGSGQTDIELSLSANAFTLVKTDNGPAFTAGAELSQWPLAGTVGTVVKIYADSLNGLFAKITSPQSVVFYTEDYDDDGDFLVDISEHYGLMIISRACHSFTYHIDPHSGLNTFTATINL